MTILLSSALFFWAATAQAQDLDWVRLFVSSRDSSMPVLRTGDLSIACGGKEDASAPLRPYQQPVSVAIIIQWSRDMAKHLTETQRALRSFLRNARPDDEFFTVKALEQPALGSGFTSDVDAIVSSIAAPEGAKRPKLYDAVEFALRYLGHSRHADRAILILTANEDVASNVKAKAIMPSILAQRIPVYVASMYRRYADDLAPTFFELLQMAERSGGDMWEVFRFSKLDKALSAVNFHPQYVLGISPEFCSAKRKLRVDWAEGFAHQGLTLRYQRELLRNAGLADARRVSEGSSH